MKEELRFRAEQYASERGLTLTDELGHGVHGSVFSAESQARNPLRAPSAVKAHANEVHFVRERDVYFRLRKKSIAKIRGFEVPQLIDHDENWLILEMTIVTRPFVLDFAGAYLDKAPDFSEEVMADWRAAKLEQFGAKRWCEVQAILAVLEAHGVFMEDVHPGNIAIAGELWASSSS
jgi:hypothetical protein